MKRKTIIVLIVLISIMSVILFIKVIRKNNIIISKKQITSNSEMRNEEIKNEINNLKIALKDKKREARVIVNGKIINEKEIAYIDFQLKREELSTNIGKKEAIEEAIEEYIILDDAKEKSITLTEKQIKEIDERTRVLKNDENTKEMLEAFDMKYSEFIDFYKEMNIRTEIIIMWQIDIIDGINRGEIKVNNKVFENKYNEYISTKDTGKRYKLLLEMKHIYIEHLKDKATIEYIN